MKFIFLYNWRSGTKIM